MLEAPLRAVLICHCRQCQYSSGGGPNYVALVMREAFEVMDGWGFEYKTHAVWDKEKIGMGYWFRGQHELLLVGTKGKVSPPAPEHRVSSVFREARRAHSEKPDCVYEWIEAAFPHLLKLEMYYRRPREGWLVFGNEAVA